MLMIDPDGMRSRYNWDTGNYENNGEITDFQSVQQEYGVGQSKGCPPNCPQNVAKADATATTAGGATPQIASGSTPLPQQEEAMLSNTDLRYLHGTQFTEYEKAIHTGTDIASLVSLWGAIKNIWVWTKAVNAGTKLVTQFSTSTIDNAVALTMKQKELHIFANSIHPKPWLNQLSIQLGGNQNVIKLALQNANGRILPNTQGIFNTSVDVGGVNFTIRGYVNQGTPIVNSIFIP